MLLKWPRPDARLRHYCICFASCIGLVVFLNMICSQKQVSPAADKDIASAEVATPAVKEVDRLQQDVDPKLLVSSGGKGPPAQGGLRQRRFLRPG